MLNKTNSNKTKVQSRTSAGKNAINNIVIAIALVCGQWLTANAQTINAQRGITTQAVARDASGNIIANQNISVRFSLITGSVSGPVYYQETQSLTTNSLGLFNTSIFAGTSLNTMGVFDPSKWTTIAGMGAFIKIEMDITGGTNYIDMGTTQLLSVPFALYAETAGKATGSVNFMGTWNAATNTPDLSLASPDKGDYYEVGAAGATPLGPISDWGTGDWAIYNGAVWSKVDNTDGVTDAQNVSGTGANIYKSKIGTLLQFKQLTNTDGSIVLQDNTNAIDVAVTQDATHRFATDAEKATWNAKQNKVIPVSPGNFAGLDASGDLTDSQRSPADYLDKTNTVAYSPTADYNPATKKYVDDTAVAIGAQSGSKVNRSGDTMTGDLILNADPTAALGAVTKQYVDAADNAMQSQVSSKVNRAGDTMTGNLVLNADPTSALGATTKQYVDAADNAMQAQVSSKVNRAGDTMTGDLILNADPTAALGAATKKYVDDAATSLGVSNKADKVVGATFGNFAILNGSGNLMDSGKNPADYLHISNTTPFTPSADYNPATKKYVDDTAIAIDAQVSSKVNRAGDTMTGDLILNADPTVALGAATKKYVDDTATGLGISNKADKVIGATNGHFAALNANGNLTDGGAKEATNISFTPNTDITSINVQDAIDELQLDFTNSIDSYVNKIDDGVAIYLPPGGLYKRFGLGGETTPASPLGIKGETGQDDEMITMTSADLSRKWNINLNPTAGNVAGFSIDNTTSGTAISRFFIDQISEGNVGIGTVTPTRKLHIESSTSAGITGIRILNTATTVNQGWSMGHLQDASIVRNGAFSLIEEPAVALGIPAERMTILPGGNVGINEKFPDVMLHVNRPSSDPLANVSLACGTGIFVIGSTGNGGIDSLNIVMDSRSIQARKNKCFAAGQPSAKELSLQPYGGGITINANSVAPSHKATITTDGMLGLGTTTPVEKIDIDGAIKIGTTTTTNAGTFRWSGADFEGYDGTDWKSFTLSNWGGTLTLSGEPAITYNVANPKVGIGVANPSAALEIHESSSVTGSSTALLVSNSGSGSSSSLARVGLGINCSGVWSANPSALNIGLHVSSVSGQSNSNANIGALINGNVVIGGITTSEMIGTNGTKVLAIQNGTAPASAISGSGLAADGGIQMYSQSDAMGTSTFNVMNGDGTIIKLFRAAALTPASNTPVSPVYDPAVQALIENMRQRINDLEAKLQALGLLN